MNHIAGNNTKVTVISRREILLSHQGKIYARFEWSPTSVKFLRETLETGEPRDSVIPTAIDTLGYDPGSFGLRTLTCRIRQRGWKGCKAVKVFIG